MDMQIEVTAAIIRQGNKVLICQRDSNDDIPDLWEFPGGKVEPGESLEDCIRREIQEELELQIEPQAIFGTTTYDYRDRQLHFTFYTAVIKSGTMVLNVHQDARWITLQELENFSFMPGDVPVVERLIEVALEETWPEMPFTFEIGEVGMD
jgi:8-oxo-dGTP diphosphatase